MFLTPVRALGAETREGANPPPWGLPASPGKGQPRLPPGRASAWACACAWAADSAPAAGIRLTANRNMTPTMRPPARPRDWFSAQHNDRGLLPPLSGWQLSTFMKRGGRRGAALGPEGRKLLDVGDGHDWGGLREGLGLVLGPDAVDIAAAALGEAFGGLHAALGDEDAQVGAVELEVARAVHAHEEGYVLGGDLVPVVGDVLEGERAAVDQAPGAGARGGQDALHVVAGLLHDQLRPDVHGRQRTPAVVDLLHVDGVVHVHELKQVEQE